MKRSSGPRPVYRTVGLVAKTTSEEALRLALSLEKALRQRHLEVCFESGTAEALERPDGVPVSRVSRVSDLTLVLGGDGTLLSVARAAPAGKPVLGINVGVLGFLAGLRREEALTRLDEVLGGGFREDKRRRFEVRIPSGAHKGTYRALNDAVLNKEALARISTFAISLDGRPAARFRADGIIVSTPTGSTAYNLSAGGPILHPSLAAVVVTPICPHTLTQRPLVVPAATRIGLSILDRGRTDGVYLTLDGQEGFPITRDCSVEVRPASSPVTLLRPPESDHFDKLAEKLNWGL